MTNKTTKKALLLSSLSMLLCFAMLLGTTFAWFTDSVTSSNNIITAGNLDVAMYWADGTENPAAANWTDASAGAIFNYDNWEPGYVDVKHIKIANEGTLALKYQVAIIANGAVSELSDVIDVYYADPAAQVEYRTDLSDANKIGTLAEVLAGMATTAYGELPAGKNHTITLAMKMQEEAGNEYQGLAIGSSFSVQLVATQLTYEGDSFGTDYDESAKYPWDGSVGEVPGETENVITVSNATELAAFAEAVRGGNTYSGKTVKLANSIDLNNKNWTSIGTLAFDRDNSGSFSNIKAFKGTFDGQGNTIYNLKASSVTGGALFGAVDGATIKNLNVKNVNITGDNTVAAIVGFARNSTITNCHVSGEINLVADWAYVAGIVAYGYVNVSDCSVIADGTGVIKSENRNAVGAICGWVNETSSGGIRNCVAKNLKITGWANVGAIAGYVGYGNTIDSCSAENITLTKTRDGGNPSIGLATGGWLYKATVGTTITNNTFKNITLNGNAKEYAAKNTIYGSEYYGETDVTKLVVNNNTLTGVTDNITLYTP